MTNLDARPAPAGKPAHLDSTATGETDHTPAHGLPSATYLLAGAPFQPDTDLGQSLLDKAYGKHERPQCPCTPQGVPMYIAKVGVRYIVKRMPETGLAHSPSCASYVPEHLTAFGQLLGDAVALTGRSLANVATPERQELRWDDVVQRRSTPSGRRSSAG